MILRRLIGQAAEFKFESKFVPLPGIWQSLKRLFQKVIEGLVGKINGQALWAAIFHCLGRLDGQAQTQGVSELAAVAARDVVQPQITRNVGPPSMLLI